jgi:hypothetical protein
LGDFVGAQRQLGTAEKEPGDVEVIDRLNGNSRPFGQFMA